MADGVDFCHYNITSGIMSRTEYDALQVERAAYFTAVLFIGRGQYERREASSLEGARSLARTELAPLSDYGQRPLIYAVSPEGLTIHIE